MCCTKRKGEFERGWLSKNDMGVRGIRGSFGEKEKQAV